VQNNYLKGPEQEKSENTGTIYAINSFCTEHLIALPNNQSICSLKHYVRNFPSEIIILASLHCILFCRKIKKKTITKQWHYINPNCMIRVDSIARREKFSAFLSGFCLGAKDRNHTNWIAANIKTNPRNQNFKTLTLVFNYNRNIKKRGSKEMNEYRLVGVKRERWKALIFRRRN